MRKEPEFFIPVRESDIGLGRPLKWAVYNASHDLLLKRGNVVETRLNFDLLLQEGCAGSIQGSRAGHQRNGSKKTGGGQRVRKLAA